MEGKLKGVYNLSGKLIALEGMMAEYGQNIPDLDYNPPRTDVPPIPLAKKEKPSSGGLVVIGQSPRNMAASSPRDTPPSVSLWGCLSFTCAPILYAVTVNHSPLNGGQFISIEGNRSLSKYCGPLLSLLRNQTLMTTRRHRPIIPLLMLHLQAMPPPQPPQQSE